MSVRLAGAVLLALLSSACAHGTGSTRPRPGGPAAAAEGRARAASEARWRLLRGLEARDHDAVATVLAPDFELVVPTNDTIRGAEQAVATLLHLMGHGTTPLRLYAGKIEPCVGTELVEYDGVFTGPPAAGALAGSFAQGTFAVSWREVGDRVVAQRLVLGGRRTFERPPSWCRLEYLATADAQRWSASIAIETLVDRPSRGMRAVSAGMAEQGYDQSGSDAMAFPRLRTNIKGFAAGVRYRFSPSWSAELQGAMRPDEEAEGLYNVAWRHVFVRSNPVSFTALGQYHLGIVRLGIGPSLLLQNFSTEERIERLGEGDGGTWENVYNVPPRTAHARAPAAGAAAQATVAFPMGTRTMGELRLGVAGYGRSAVPSTPTYTGNEVSSVLATLGFALAVGW